MTLNIQLGHGNTNIFCFSLDIQFRGAYTSMEAQTEAFQLYFEDPWQSKMIGQVFLPRKYKLISNRLDHHHLQVQV